ncbi:MAG: hypothetical protein WD468_03890 [Pirellulales bacterium]
MPRQFVRLWMIRHQDYGLNGMPFAHDRDYPISSAPGQLVLENHNIGRWITKFVPTIEAVHGRLDINSDPVEVTPAEFQHFGV